MNIFTSYRKKFIGVSFLFYIGAFFGGINLYLNDKLRAEMEGIIKAERKKEELKIIHERVAPSYEKKTENLEVRNQFNKYRRILVSYAKGKVLECGVGTGRTLEFYKSDADLIGIDYSAKMLEIAKHRIDNRELHNINKDSKIVLTNMDCEHLKDKFPENYFDSVVDINNFQAYHDYKKVYDGIKFVLKDEGLFLFMARGESNFFLIRDFYKIFLPCIFMRKGQDLTINWSELIEKDKDWEILHKERKNYGKTYIYILKLKKKKQE